MGVQLESYFERALEKNGVRAQMRLVMLTKMTRKDATAADDTPENVKMFAEAIAKI